MQLEVQKYLFDIKTAIESINDYLGDSKDYKNYLNNKLLRRGVEREIEIIGEAANNLLKIDSNIGIENARKIVDVRNFVIHSYDKIDDTIIWSIVTRHLPILYEQVKTLIDKNI